MPQAHSYVRFSSAPQAKGSSLERQQKKVADWLKANPDYHLSDLKFEDLGVSGWDGSHIEGGMGKLLAAVEHGFIRSGDCILIEDLSRAGRLPMMQMVSKVITPILEAGVTLVTMQDGLSYTKENMNNGGHVFVLVALIQAANKFSDGLADKVTASYDKRRREAATGTRPKRRTPLWLTSEGELVEHLVPHIRSAFEDYAAGLGERRIIRRLHETGVEEFQDLYGSTLKRWLQNRIAIGYWGDIPKVYPAVVTPDLFYRVQERIAGNRTTRPASPTKHVLTGLVKCGHCGRNFNSHVFKDQPTVLQCSNRFMSTVDKCENSKSIPLGVLDYIKALTSPKALQKAMQGQQLTTNQKRRVAIEGELGDVSTALSKLAGVLDMMDDVPEFAAKTRELVERRKALQQELAILDSTVTDMTVVNAILLDESGDIDDMTMNALLQSVGYTITCYKSGEIHVSYPLAGQDDLQPFQYVGYQRGVDSYVVRHGDKEQKLPVMHWRLNAGRMTLGTPKTSSRTYIPNNQLR